MPHKCARNSPSGAINQATIKHPLIAQQATLMLTQRRKEAKFTWLLFAPFASLRETALFFSYEVCFTHGVCARLWFRHHECAVVPHPRRREADDRAR
jgi:hypothetical protein